MPSRDARIDCGAKANAAKFNSDPEMKMTVPTTQTFDWHLITFDDKERMMHLDIRMTKVQRRNLRIDLAVFSLF